MRYDINNEKSSNSYVSILYLQRELQNKPCFDLQCKGFVQVGKFALGQQITPVSVYKGKQVALTFLLFQVSLITKILALVNLNI
jgi:hypothetical protein